MMTSGSKIMKTWVAFYACFAIVQLPEIVRGQAPARRVAYIRLKGSSEEFVKQFTVEGVVPKDRKQHAVNELIKMTTEKQKKVVQAIKDHTTKYFYETFWVINMVVLNSTDSALLAKITEIEDVESINIYPASPSDISDGDLAKVSSRQNQSSDAQWNIKQLKVPEVWETGINGSGVVVGTIHHGAFVDNTLIRHNFRGDRSTKGYGFYEPLSNGCAHAHFTSNTSTFRVGLAAARKGYGVAPGSLYILCSALPLIEPTFFDCVHWIICPHNGGTVNGTDTDCTKAPAAVSISNEMDANPGAPDVMVESINMMTIMGITVITDAGRIEGNPCRKISVGCTANSGICVGFTNQDGKRSKHSACGPGPGNSIKPDILVPGYLVTGPAGCIDECPGDVAETSCEYTDDGSSSGAGHVLGVVALMVQKNPELTPPRIKKILIESSQRVADEDFQCCGDLGSIEYPNYCSGHGLLDAKKAVASS